MTDGHKKIDVGYVAKLARLSLSPAESEAFQSQLEQIVGYVEKIGALDLEGIEPTSHATPIHNVLRGDDVKEWGDNRKFLANAPARIEDQFMVPKIVE